jgi:hypothetical protein
MDSTTRQRYISTSIWSDEWFDSLSTLEKLIYFHLLTNEFTNAAGVYHFSLKRIRTDLDISREEVQAAIDKFEAAGKAYYFQEYIIIPKWLKHQKISERSKMFLGALAVLRGLPDDIKRFIADRKHYDFPVEKYVKILPLNSPSDGPCPVEDGPPPKKVWPIPKKGVAHAKNAANSAHDSDLDLDLDSDLDLDLGGGGRSDYSDPPSGENPVREEPPPLLDTIKKNADRAGFVIGDSVARKFLASGLDSSWFSGSHDFLAFMAHTVRAKYPDEPPERQRDIFLSAISWDNLRAAYPGWRKRREAEARKKIAVHARDHPPEICRCGRPLPRDGRCPHCFGKYEFEGDRWVFYDCSPEATGDIGAFLKARKTVSGEVSKNIREEDDVF